LTETTALPRVSHSRQRSLDSKSSTRYVRGHGERADPIQLMVGAAFLSVFLRVCSALAWG
jgi:hypothetical protein